MNETLIWHKSYDAHNESLYIKDIEDIKVFKPLVKEKIVKTDNFNEIKNKAESIILLFRENREQDNFINFTIYRIISDQLDVINFLTKYINNNSNDIVWEEIRIYYEYLYQTSYFLSVKYLEKEVTFFDGIDEMERPKRSSYNECKKKVLCDFMFSENKNFKCFCEGDHYVHHKLSKDIDCLIKFIDLKHNIYELETSNKTFYIVITNMYEHLKYFKEMKFNNRDCSELNLYYNGKNIKNQNENKTYKGKYKRREKRN